MQQEQGRADRHLFGDSGLHYACLPVSREHPAVYLDWPLHYESGRGCGRGYDRSWV